MTEFPMKLLLVALPLTLLVASPANAFDPDQLQQLLTTNFCSQCDLSGADLSNKNLTDAHLGGANLQNANLSGATLDGADLSGADFTDANVTGASHANTNKKNIISLPTGW